jgi:adenylate cyclase
LGCAIGIAGVLASFVSFTHNLEEQADLALLFKLRGIRQPPPQVMVVSIDRESSEALGLPARPERWPRSYYAELISKLTTQGAAAVVFDLYFIEPRGPDQDHLLAHAMKAAGNVVLAELLKVKTISATRSGNPEAADHRLVQTIKPIEEISKAAFATAPFVLPRVPVRVNHYWTFLADAGDSPTFPVVAFQLYAMRVYQDFLRLIETVRPDLGQKVPRDPAAAIRADGAVDFIKNIRKIFDSDPTLAPDLVASLNASQKHDENAKLLTSLVKMYGGAKRRYLNYYGTPRTIATLPFHTALTASGPAGSADFRGKLVFVGLSEKELAERDDSFHTVFSQENGVFISGVEIAATAVANLLEDLPVVPLATGHYLLLVFLWGALIGLLGVLCGALAASLLILAAAAGYLLFAQHQFAAGGIWLPVVVPLFAQAPLGFCAAMLLKYRETNRERRNIREALSHYVPAEIIGQLARNRMDMRKSGETVYGVCLFSDAAGYTSFAEKHSPRELRELMHRYFEATFAPIRDNGGRVLGLAGDSILAVWKASGAAPEARKQACMAALGVARAVTRFNQSFTDAKLPVRIAVHAGEIFLGNIGASEHYEYGVTGDTVNTASRMDSLNKFLGTQIVVSEDVIRGLEGFLTREAGTFLLKGKSQPVAVHELKCALAESEETQKQACAIFAQGLRAFRARSWREAREQFDSCLKLMGDDPLSRRFLNLCREYSAHPPDPSWGGVIAMEEK